MQTLNHSHGRVRRAVNDLVVAEMFLVQATIESATVIGEGVNELGKHLSRRDEASQAPAESISAVLQRIADDALEPYASRFKYFRGMINSNDALRMDN
ncbi:MAG: hypothetical protein R3E64_07705 [Halioglobus sp.]